MKPTTIDDFHARHVVLDNGCWLWTGHVGNHGYGVFGHKGTDFLAHRLSYELHVGPIPDGLVIDHLCRNRKCVNPAHMEPVTNRENLMRAPTYGKPRVTHCLRGHEYTPENTYVSPDGKRFCRGCRTRPEHRAQMRELGRKNYYRKRDEQKLLRATRIEARKVFGR